MNTRLHLYRGTKGLACLFLTLQICSWTPAAQPLPIALVPLANRSGDTNLAHWQFTIPSLLATELFRAKSIRVLPDSTTDFAFHELGLEPGSLMNSGEARKFGRICEARQVIYGTYEQSESGWRLALKIVSVATGKMTEIRPVSASRLTDAVNQQVEALLSQLNVSVSRDDRRLMQTPPTSSEEALALASRAYSGLNHGGSLESAIKEFRSALSLDPDFVKAQEALAHCLMAQNRWDEAAKIAKAVLATHPNDADAHAEVGQSYLNDDLPDLARDEFSRAHELDPGETQYSFPLAVVYFQQNNWSSAISVLEKAEKLAPFDAPVHALLGYCYGHLQRRTDAYAQLNVADNYNFAKDLLVEDWLALGYQELCDPTKAAEHFKIFLKLADAVGYQSDKVDDARTTLAYLEMRLTPHPLAIVSPPVYSQTELDTVLKARISPADLSSVVNPLTPAPRMVQWAQQLVGNAHDDLEKAKRLFDGLTRRINTGEKEIARTAIEAYKAWPDAQAKFMCQDYTFLYVALARSVGLKAYYVLVRQDYSGKYVGHACAGVFIDGAALLVDPAYDWFGVPHKGYEIEDDLRVVAYYMCQTGDLAKIDLALRIAPDWGELHFGAADAFASKGALKRVNEQIEAGLKLDSQSWRALFARATLDDAEHNWSDAEEHFRQCLAINPDAPHARVFLARELFLQEKMGEARDELQSLLQDNHTAEDGAKAREMIDYLNDALARKAKP